MSNAAIYTLIVIKFLFYIYNFIILQSNHLVSVVTNDKIITSM